MSKPQTAPRFIESLVRHVFLDVVMFTQRSVERQAYVIATLNSIVKQVILEQDIKPSHRLLLPTGDGLCISLLKTKQSDTPLVLSLSILKHIAKHNAQKDLPDGMQFGVRIGINQNDDILVKDINGRKNVAGDGINNAQRIMNFGDAGHILVGRSVYDTLNNRDAHRAMFHHRRLADKNDRPHDVYQYINSKHVGLTSTPVTVGAKTKQRKRPPSQVVTKPYKAISYGASSPVPSSLIDRSEGSVSILAYVDNQIIRRSGGSDWKYLIAHATHHEQHKVYGRYPNAWAICCVRSSDATADPHWRFYSNGESHPQTEIRAKAVEDGWHAFTITWSKKANTIRFYVDGETEESQKRAFQNWPVNFRAEMSIGNWVHGTSHKWMGGLSFVIHTSTFLSNAQVKRLVNNHPLASPIR